MTKEEKKLMKDLAASLNDSRKNIHLVRDGVHFFTLDKDNHVKESYFIKLRTVTVDGIDEYEYRPRLQK